MKPTKVVQTVGLLVLAVVFSSFAVAKKPYLDLDGEKSHDGLYPVKKAKVDQAWASDHLDFSQYTKVMFIGAGLHYRPVKDPGRSRSAISNADFFPLDDKQKERLQEMVTEQFTKELAKLERFEIVTEPGPDVLAVRGGLYDIVSRVPPQTAGNTDYYLSSVGAATMVLEFVDIPSNSVIVRVVDGRSAEQRGYVQESNSVTNAAEVRRLLQQWARMLRQSLERIVEIDAEGKVVRD